MDRPLALIIEDEPDSAFIFAAALRAAGFDTEIVGDGRSALERIVTAPPGVVVLDLCLPQVSGVTILQLLRTDPRCRNVRVIIVTAAPEKAEPLAGQADLVLIKPIGFIQLRDLAARLASTLSSDQGERKI